VVDVAAGHLYWTNMGNPKANDGSIFRSDLDGRNMTTIIAAGWHLHGEAAADRQANGKLYWCDREGMRVMRGQSRRLEDRDARRYEPGRPSSRCGSKQVVRGRRRRCGCRQALTGPRRVVTTRDNGCIRRANITSEGQRRQPHGHRAALRQAAERSTRFGSRSGCSTGPTEATAARQHGESCTLEAPQGKRRR